MKKFDHFSSNLDVLARAGQEDLDNEFIISGIIDKFSLQFELGWKSLKELLRYEGRAVASVGSLRAVIKEAYAVYDFIDESVWLSMLKARNDLSHIYDGGEAKRMVRTILDEYIPAFLRMRTEVLRLYGDCLDEVQ